MRSKIDEMMEMDAFCDWLRRFQDTANYFVASTNGPSKETALKLCLAYAFEAGQQSWRTCHEE